MIHSLFDPVAASLGFMIGRYDSLMTHFRNPKIFLENDLGKMTCVYSDELRVIICTQYRASASFYPKT